MNSVSREDVRPLYKQVKDRLLELLGLAAAFYERHLWDSPAAGPARDYVTGQRALDEEVCREFHLGYAPGGAVLTRKAL